MSATDDLVVSPIAVDLVAVLTTEFNLLDDTLGVPRRPVSLRPGDRLEFLASSTEDECCTGVVVVRPGEVYPSRRFPEQDATSEPCDVMQYAVAFELGAARCAPVGTVESLPTTEAWGDVTLATLLDGAALRRALCRLKAMDDYTDRLVLQGRQGRITTEGGCVGTTLDVVVNARACDCTQIV